MDSIGGITQIKYFIFRQDCYDSYFNQNEISDACLVFTYSKFVSYIVVILASIMKLP